jgi:hypothetical protein
MPLTELSESALRRIARKRIEDRQLPRIVPERMWGTPKGTSQLCCLCDRAITPDEVTTTGRLAASSPPSLLFSPPPNIRRHRDIAQNKMPAARSDSAPAGEH